MRPKAEFTHDHLMEIESHKDLYWITKYTHTSADRSAFGSKVVMGPMV